MLTRSNYWRKMQKIAINRPFRLFFTKIEIVQELLISNMHNKFEQDTWKTVHVIAPTRSNWRKMQKIAISRPFWIFFSHYWTCLRTGHYSNMHNKFGKDTWKPFYVIAPTRSNYWRKMHFLLGTSITNFKGIHEQLFKLSSPQGQIIDYTVKNHNKSAILTFFQPLLNLSENCFLVTCITHFKRILEKLPKLSRPQGQIIEVNCEKLQ